MTEKSIIKNLTESIDYIKFPYQIPNAFIYNWECDYWTLCADGYTREFEIKISRQDFINDANKIKHQSFDGANYFYYVCPTGLIKPYEINKKYGLLYVSDSGNVSVIKSPRKLHEKTFNQWKMLANKMFYKWLGLWKEKYINGEFNRSEYFEGFNIDILKEELI